MTAHTFPHHRRIRSKNDFTELIHHGTRYKGELITFFYAPATEQSGKIGISIGRKYGNAVRRNRFKRLVRESYRRTEGAVQDINIVAIPAFTRQAPSLARCREDLAALLRSAHKEPA